MLVDLGRIILPRGMRDPCGSENAHKDLCSFEQNVEEWEKSDREESSKEITNILLVLAHPKSDCWRFFYKTFNKLSEVTPELRIKHMHYWDTWGTVAGGVLGAEFEVRDIAFSWLIFNPRIHEFIEGDWELRSLVIRAFRGVARQCAQWDNALEDVLRYYYAYCWATTSVLRRRLPKQVGDALEWLFEAWDFVAEKCYKDRCKLLQKGLSKEDSINKRAEIEKTVCKIIGAAFHLLKIIDRMYDLGSGITGSCWTHWREMLFDHTLSDENLAGAQRSLIMTKRVKSDLEEFCREFSELLLAVGDASKRQFLKPWLNKCCEILSDFNQSVGDD